MLHDLRRRRKRHRLGDIEWFDAAYRVYPLAPFGGGTVLWISSSIKDTTVSASAIADVARNGPAVIGMITAAGLSCRGAQRRARRPPGAGSSRRRLRHDLARRSTASTAAPGRPASCGRSAYLARPPRGDRGSARAGRRLPGSTVAWAASGLLFGDHPGDVLGRTALVVLT